jgi:glutamate dehydrogenase (NAD(P)+)
MQPTGDGPIPGTPLFVAEITDSRRDLQGWVAVHSCIDGRSGGGVRILPDVTRREVEHLAEAMTYKYSFQRLPRGGAKAGLRLPPGLTAEERERSLQRFGERLRPLLSAKLFQPWTDMGCSADDLRSILLGAGLKMPRAGSDSAGYTACSGLAGLIAVARHHGLAPRDCAVTIEGFGAVGRRLAVEITAWGGRLIGASTRHGAVVNLAGLDVGEVLAASERSDGWVTTRGGWDTIARAELIDLPMQVHVPGARVHSIDAGTAGRLGCVAVVPLANVPCAPEGIKILEERGITLLPDFVTNSGGVVGPHLELYGWTPQAVRGFFLGEFQEMLSRLLVAADGRQRTPLLLAMDEAEKGYHELEQRGERQRERSGRPWWAWRRPGRGQRLGADLADEILAGVAARFSDPEARSAS